MTFYQEMTEYRWNLSRLYTGLDDPQLSKDYQTFVERIDTFVARRDRDVNWSDELVLTQALDDYESLRRVYYYGSREMVYRWLLDTVDGSDETKSRLSLAESQSKEQMVRLQFFELSLGQIDPTHHERLLDVPSLGRYRHYLERLRSTARYDLTPETEKAMSLLSTTAYTAWSDMIEDALKAETRPMTIDTQTSPKTLEELMSLTKHDNKTVRDQAAIHIHDIVEKLSFMATRELNSVLEYKKTTDTLRGYDRPDRSRIVSEDIDASVVDALLQAVTDSNDIAHRFYALKARLMGQQTLAYHERNVPIRLTDESSPTYTFEQGSQILTDVLTKMDDDFVAVRERCQAEGLVDVYPRTGKRGGAFNAGMGQEVINVIMLNRTDTLTDVTTLAHEMGHMIHTQLVYEHQHALHASYGMFTAEVASQFIEDYVYDEITGELSDIQQLELMMEKLNDMISSIHRQIACYRYEQTLHQTYRSSGFLSTERLGEMFAQQMESYMGPSVSQDPGSQHWRVYRSHIRSYFYVFSYAGALILAKSLQSRVADGSLTFADVKERFYTIGRNQSPQQTFDSLGIDITDPSVWTEGLAYIDDQLTQAEALAEQLGY